MLSQFVFVLKIKIKRPTQAAQAPTRDAPTRNASGYLDARPTVAL